MGLGVFPPVCNDGRVRVEILTFGPQTRNRGEREDEGRKKKTPEDAGWWGIASGPVAVINEKALKLFWKVMNGASWRNLHWLPHQVLVYEVRVPEGYGMRWSQDQGDPGGGRGRGGREGGEEGGSPMDV
ncbi:hypothetical protein NLJ89_g10510 [Agrocybe chaxingu]|uniref:Uncharacterized protein n=1 Tax=Agrocybe chaxingu TaxID=84603 RepID=A0A9W8MQV0_9AGAR|nr:hypothetical protein NLJ89_g10510 [Agrocybe chaxingu]